jgi:phosphohistidine phosphatase
MSATRRLAVVRHAKSDQQVGGADHDRPINARGRRDAPALGRWLAEHLPQPDLVLCSSALRAVQTWDLAAAELPAASPLDVLPSLYQTSPQRVVAQLAEVDDVVRTLVLVGHEPVQSHLADWLSGGEGEPEALALLAEGFSTCGVAVLETESSWAGLRPGSCRLTAYAAPRG